MLAAAQIERMTAVAEESMMDACVVQAYTSNVNAVGDDVPSYTDGSAIACGVRFSSDREPERMTLDGTTYDVDATVRLPKGTSVDTRDRIKVTHRYGDALASPWVFLVLGMSQVGPTATVVKCKRVVE